MAKQPRKKRAKPQLHDEFFKLAFTNTELATAYFTQFLPTELCAKLDFSTLTLQPDSFITDELPNTSLQI